MPRDKKKASLAKIVKFHPKKASKSEKFMYFSWLTPQQKHFFIFPRKSQAIFEASQSDNYKLKPVIYGGRWKKRTKAR